MFTVLFSLLLLTSPRSAPTYLATVGLISRRLHVYSVSQDRMDLVREIQLTEDLGSPASVAVSRDFVSVVISSTRRNLLIRYQVQNRSDVNGVVQDIPSSATSVAIGSDGTTWLGRSIGIVEKAPDAKANDRDELNSFPSRLVVNSSLNVALLGWRATLINDSIPQLLLADLGNTKPGRLQPAQWPWTDFGFVKGSRNVWKLDGSETLTIAEITIRGDLARQRNYRLTGFSAEVGTSLGGSRFLLAAATGDVREIDVGRETGVTRGNSVSTGLSLEGVAHLSWSKSCGAILLGRNGIVRLRPNRNRSWKVVGKRPLNEPVVVADSLEDR